MITAKNIIKEIGYFFHSPGKYIYSFTYPSDKSVCFEAYNPKAKATASKLARRLNKEFPGLHANLFGSVALEILGQNDIDLMIESCDRNFRSYVSAIVSEFGEPVKTSEDFVQWNFTFMGFRVDLTLTDAGSAFYRRFERAYVLLSKPVVKNEYIKLKILCNGRSIREYELARLRFFSDYGLYD